MSLSSSSSSLSSSSQADPATAEDAASATTTQRDKGEETTTSTSSTSSSRDLGFLMGVLLLHSILAGGFSQLEQQEEDSYYYQSLAEEQRSSSPFYSAWAIKCCILGIMLVVCFHQLLSNIIVMAAACDADSGGEMNRLLTLVQNWFVVGTIVGNLLVVLLPQGEANQVESFFFVKMICLYCCWRYLVGAQQQQPTTTTSSTIATSSVVLGSLVGILVLFTVQGATFVAFVHLGCDKHNDNLKSVLLFSLLVPTGCILLTMALLRQLVSTIIVIINSNNRNKNSNPTRKRAVLLQTILHHFLVGGYFGFVPCWILTCIIMGKPLGLVHLGWIVITSIIFCILPQLEPRDDDDDDVPSITVTTIDATREPLLIDATVV